MESDELLGNGSSVWTHGTSGGLLSLMAQTALGGTGQLSFAVTLVHPALKEEMQRVERL